MKLVELDPKEIIPYNKNPRKNDEAVKYVTSSIKEFGFRVPLLLDENKVIITGDTRYKACLLLGLNKIPCIIADDMDEEHKTAYRVVDNKSSEKAEWDNFLLYEELSKIDNIDMSIYDIDMNRIKADIDRIEKELNSERKDHSYKIYEEYAVIIDCENESELETVYNKLQEEGYNCRILT